jgi:GAF domain-containing protein/CheY-like chemotaxis protein
MSNKTAHRILIVDDHLGFRKSLELRLQVEGYDTLAVAGARHALREMERAAGAYDLVLMDQRLENQRAGIEATRTITRRWPDTEVVVMTGYGDREASMAAMEAGACRYVYKTGKVVSEIVNIVEALDDMRDLERQLRDPSAERGWLQNIILDLGCGIAIIDRSYRVLYLNDAGKELVDKGAQIGGICWVEFYRAYTQDEPCPNCPVRVLYEGREPIKVIKLSAGGDRYIETTATLLKKDDKIIGAIKAGRDVTDREHLFQMERGMVGTLSLDERLNVILMGIKVLGYDRVRLYLLSPDGEALVGRVQIGGTRAESFLEVRLRLEEDAYSRNTLKKGKPILYKPGDLGPNPLWIDELLDKHGIPWIDLPLLVNGQPVGLISLDNKHSGKRLKKGELTRLMPYANSAAQAIATAREHEAVRTRALGLEKLREVDAEITRTPLERREVLRRIVRACLELTGANSADIRLIERDKLVLMASVGVFSEVLAQELPMSQVHIPCVWVARTGTRYLANQAQEDKYVIEWKSKLMDESDLRILGSLGSYVSYPLEVGDKTIGVLFLQSEKPDFFTDEICTIVEDFRSRAAIAIENAQLFEEIQRRLRELNSLFEVGRNINTVLNEDQLLQIIVEAAVQAIPASDRGSMHLLDEGEGQLTIRASVGYSLEVARVVRLKVGEGLAGLVVQTGQPLIVESFQADSRVARHDAHPEVAEIKSSVCAPLTTRERIIGTLSVDSVQQEGAFSAEDARLLSVLANQAAIAIENARLHTDTEKKAIQLDALLKISQHITAQLELNPVLARIVEYALEQLKADVVILRTYDQRKDQFEEPVFAGSLYQEEKEKYKVVTKESVIYKVIRRDEPYYADDAEHDPIMTREFTKRERVKASVGCPLKVGGEPVGVMFVNYRVPHRFTEAEKSTISLFAQSAAIAIQNARQYQSVSERLETASATAMFLSAMSAWSHGVAQDTFILRAYAEALRGCIARPDAQIRSILDKIESKADAIANIIPDLPSSDIEKAEFIKLSSIFEDLREGRKEEIASHCIEVESDLDALPPLYINSQLVSEALDHLIQNAIRAMPQGGKLTVSGKVVGRSVLVEVGDTGTGMPREIQEQLFKGRVLGRDKSRMGVGLMLARMYINQCGGDITLVHSDEKGSVFAFDLPFAGTDGSDLGHESFDEEV